MLGKGVCEEQRNVVEKAQVSGCPWWWELRRVELNWGGWYWGENKMAK